MKSRAIEIFLLLTIIVLLFIFFIYGGELKSYFSARLQSPHSKISAENIAPDKSQENIVKQLQSRVYTASEIKGYEIRENLGAVCRSFSYFGNNDYMILFKEALDGIEEMLDNYGAHALINISVTSSTAETQGAQGSKWSHSINMLCGDMVILEKK
jgi:uncharacterized protein YbjQ (UPF0145 family)